MGQKVNPKLMRLGIVKDWENTWFSMIILLWFLRIFI
jgi:hypothetical protein